MSKLNSLTHFKESEIVEAWNELLANALQPIVSRVLLCFFPC